MAEEVWELSGVVQQLLYSPRGDYESLLLDVGGTPVQFVLPKGSDIRLAALEVGSSATVWGTVRPPSQKGDSEHELYDIVDLHPGADPSSDVVTGRVVQFNYARHGQRNGVILDTGHFLHTKPDGLLATGWAIGDEVSASGTGLRLADGRGFVIDV